MQSLLAAVAAVLQLLELAVQQAVVLVDILLDGLIFQTQ
jgi:hypothetical protein